MHIKERFQNNYDFLRFFAAIFIIFFHSFGLLGKVSEEPMVQLTNGQINFAFIGLSIFFCISGYLIAKSSVKSPTVLNYLWKRFLRIQPLLLATCFFTVFLLGPFFTTLPLKEYFLNLHTYSYFRNVMPVFGIQFNLPGVFMHLTDKGVNGSLWTLILEERLYLVMTVVFLYKKDKINYFFILVLVLNCTYFFNQFYFHGEIIPYFSKIPFFYCLLFLNSAALYLIKFNFFNRPGLLIFLSFILFYIGILIPGIKEVFIIAIPVLVNSIAKLKGVFNRFGKYGDFTYGMYIFSFPIQQVLISNGVLNPYYLFFFTLLIVYPMAVLSWNTIEKKALSLKKLVK